MTQDLSGRSKYWALGILLVTISVYTPSVLGGFIWDDDAHVSGISAVRSWQGLKDIWTRPGAIQQYYPVTWSVFWIQYHVWGLHPAGHHAINILLHTLNAILVGVLLLQLRVRGAWLAALIFALHPVHVESVAWIAELKNTLSTFFYLGSCIAYLQHAGIHLPSEFDGIVPKIPERKWYGVSLLLFLTALLSKTTTASLPAAILLVMWWKTGRLRQRTILEMLPYFILGIPLGLLTARLETMIINTYASLPPLDPMARIVIAGRALWFYAGKLLWPNPLIFIYPRWPIASLTGSALFYPICAVLVLFMLWILRERMGKSPFVAIAFFAGTLFPALGFVEIFPMRYSFVADHFQYLASIGPIALIGAGAERGLSWIGKRFRHLATAILFFAIFNLALAVLRETRKYRDSETLWQDTLAKDPSSPIAHHNLAVALQAHGDLKGALAHLEVAARLNPAEADTEINLAKVLILMGRLQEALPHFQRGFELGCTDPRAMNDYGVALLKSGRIREAGAQFQNALRLLPGDPTIQRNLDQATGVRRDSRTHV